MRVRLIALAVAILLPVLAGAQEKPASLEEEDLRFEESIRNFGFVAGAAYQCLPEAERAAHDREVIKSYTGIARLFGTDRAFFFAAAFGAGRDGYRQGQVRELRQGLPRRHEVRQPRSVRSAP